MSQLTALAGVIHDNVTVVVLIASTSSEMLGSGVEVWLQAVCIKQSATKVKIRFLIRVTIYFEFSF